MRIEDCLPLMSKAYLGRIVGSILQEEISGGDEERLSEQIRQNIGELTAESRITSQLKKLRIRRSERILTDAILTSLLDRESAFCGEAELYDQVRAFEEEIITKAASPDAFKFSDAKPIEIYETVLEVALEDGDVAPDEFALLERLRGKIGLRRSEHRLLEAKLNCFPKPGNQLHGSDEFKATLRLLQLAGILFFCNRADDQPLYVLPEELVPAAMRSIGFEMRKDAQHILHENFSTEQLHKILKTLNLPTSGTKAERSERLLSAGTTPSESLALLMNEEVGALCKKLPGVKSSGTKPERIGRIIHYFASLKVKKTVDSDDPRLVYYQYFEELASRDNQNLYQLGVIKHDRDMEVFFEEATRYLFEHKLGYDTVKLDGTDHADGCIAFPNGELLLWDNKSKESVYDFPKAHQDQFLRYIRNSVRRVNIFLVIVPSCGPDCRLQAIRCKHKTSTDTDIAIITATDLKWLAENWQRHSKAERFNLEVLNATGALDRQTLEERMTVLP